MVHHRPAHDTCVAPCRVKAAILDAVEQAKKPTVRDGSDAPSLGVLDLPRCDGTKGSAANGLLDTTPIPLVPTRIIPHAPPQLRAQAQGVAGGPRPQEGLGQSAPDDEENQQRDRGGHGGPAGDGLGGAVGQRGPAGNKGLSGARAVAAAAGGGWRAAGGGSTYLGAVPPPPPPLLTAQFYPAFASSYIYTSALYIHLRRRPFKSFKSAEARRPRTENYRRERPYRPDHSYNRRQQQQYHTTAPQKGRADDRRGSIGKVG